MKIRSQHEMGFTPENIPLIRIGETTLDYKSLPLNQKEFVDAMREAQMIEVLEEDPPAAVVQLKSKSKPMPAQVNDTTFEAKHAVHAQGKVMKFPEPTPTPVKSQTRKVRQRRKASA